MKEYSRYMCDSCGHCPTFENLGSELVCGCRSCGTMKFVQKTMAERLRWIIDHYLREFESEESSDANS